MVALLPYQMMTYDPAQHHRRSIRLQGHDYAQPGAYFVTICTQNHDYLFGDIADGEMVLNEAGQMVRGMWDELPLYYPGIETDAFIVMPNHIHGIITIRLPEAGSPLSPGLRACPPLHPPGHPPPPAGQPQGVAPCTNVNTSRQQRAHIKAGRDRIVYPAGRNDAEPDEFRPLRT